MDRSFYHFVTKHAFDRRTDRWTDRRTEFSSPDRVCIPCSAVKIILKNACPRQRSIEWFVFDMFVYGALFGIFIKNRCFLGEFLLNVVYIAVH